MVSAADFIANIRKYWKDTGQIKHIESARSLIESRITNIISKHVLVCRIHTAGSQRTVSFTNLNNKSKSIKLNIGGEYSFFLTDEAGRKITKHTPIAMQLLATSRHSNDKEWCFNRFVYYTDILKRFEVDKTDKHMPYLDSLAIMADIRQLISAMDGFGMTSRYTEIMHKYHSLF